MTDEVWDYVFGHRSEIPSVTAIPSSVLQKLKGEFEYFYPLDLRVSGKDLITNHLTFFLYNHVSLFPEEKWPRGIRANGHLLINNEKMSKSTGNFLTLTEAINLFSADGTRFALAEAGDGVDDANFEMDIANAAILKLFTLKDWMEEVLREGRDGKLRDDEGKLFHDRVFLNDVNRLIDEADKAYEK